MAYVRPARAPMVGMALRATLRVSSVAPSPPRGTLAAALLSLLFASEDSPSADSAVAVCLSPLILLFLLLCGRTAVLPLTDRRFAAICAPVRGLLFTAAWTAEAGPAILRPGFPAAALLETLIRFVLLVVAKEYDAC